MYAWEEAQATVTEIPVDREHGGLRAVIFLLFIGLAVILFLAINALVPARVINLIALLGALIGAAAITYVVEQQLKLRWKSGKSIKIDLNGVTLFSARDGDIQIPLQRDVQLLRWRFKIARRARVPKGWYMVATALQHNDDSLAVYTLMSPDAYEVFDPAGRFTKLEKPDKKQTGGDSLRLAGEQRRLHRAESIRWHEGAEMTNEDFMLYVEQVERLFAN